MVDRYCDITSDSKMVLYPMLTNLDANESPASAEGEAYSFLLNKIRRGELKPGMRLKAEEIASEIGMSRMPVREAFRRLDAEGLLTLRPNRGAVVAGFSAEQLMELFEIRSVLEGLAMRHAAVNITGSDVEELRDLLLRMDRGKNDCDQWLIRHREFHAAISRLSGRRRLVREIEKLQVLLESQMRLWFVHVEKPIKVLQEHQSLIDALISGNSDNAEAVMRDHVLNTAPAIIRFLSLSAS